MDAIMVPETLMHGRQRFIHALHISADRYQVAHRQNGEDKLKISDHKLVKVTLRCSETPHPPKGFTFASELLTNGTYRDKFVEVARETLAKKVEFTCSVNSQGRIVTGIRVLGVEEIQARLVEAWRKKSKELEDKEKEGLRGYARAAKDKLENLKSMLRRAASEPNKISFRVQVRRAERRYATAVYKLQRCKWKRRHTTEMSEEKESSEMVHRKTTPRACGTPITELKRVSPTTGKPNIESSTTGIMEIMLEEWRPIFQIKYDETAGLEAEGEELELIKQWAQTEFLDKDREGITMDAILSEENLLEAMGRVKEHTAPDEQGIPSDVYRACKKETVEHLRHLYLHILGRREMTENMKKSITTMIYKGAGGRDLALKYRPIAVTAVEYRILATAMAQRLSLVLGKLIGDSQRGFQIMRDI